MHFRITDTNNLDTNYIYDPVCSQILLAQHLAANTKRNL